jgi:Trk-type K+ transport system membrane component
MRRQLAFDIWPLALAIFAICCFERGKILNPETSAWFDIFRIIFECTSAYSTIGLSMGTPSNNYSFSGELGTASKLVVSYDHRWMRPSPITLADLRR